MGHSDIKATLNALLREIQQVGGTPCADRSEVMFPESWWGKPSNVILEAAKEVCMDCPVKLMCLETALANDEEYGVWGGLTADERRRLKRR